MSKQRFLILTNRLPFPLTDGGNLAMNAMIQGYHNAGKEVYLLAMNSSRHYVPAEQLKTIYQNIAGFDTVDIDNSVNIIGIIKNFVFSQQPNHAQRFFHKDYVRALKEVIRKFKPDVIQVESVFLSTYLPFIKDFSSATIVLRMHNIEYQVWGRLADNAKGFFKKYYLKNLSQRIKVFEEQAWSDYDLLLPITEVDAVIVKLLKFDNQLIVAHYGIDTESVVPKTKTDKWDGYHIGAMDWLPNWEAMNWFLQHVWPALHRKLPDFKFYFAGREMPEQFKNLGLEGVTCQGEVAEADEFIADKRILIVPLKSGGGIRVKIMEAMSLGKLVVSTAIGMQGIDAEPGTHYLQANGVNEFIASIDWALAHKEASARIGEDAQKLIKQKYGQKEIISRIVKKIDGMQ